MNLLKMCGLLIRLCLFTFRPIASEQFRVSYCDWPLSVVVRRQASDVRKLFYLNIFSSETTHQFGPNFTGMIPGWSPTKVVQMVLIGCISGHGVTKQVFKMQFSKIFLPETTRPRAFIFGIQHHLEVLYQYLVDNISGPL